MKKIKIVEIFKSIQGEGANTGMEAVFVRLANCNLECWFCDTKFDKYIEYSINELKKEIEKFNCKVIIWTGGEPTLQLTSEILSNFKEYFNCIETNGTNRVPKEIDYIACSPKVNEKTLLKNFPRGVNELRYPISDKIPKITDLPRADFYFLSPLFVGKEKERLQLDQENIIKCINYTMNNKTWKLSIQIHKLLKIQ